MAMQTVVVQGKPYSVHMPKNADAAGKLPVVYLCGGETAEILKGIELAQKVCPPFMVVFAPPADWWRDLSPWKSEPIGFGGNTFGGQADVYLQFLQNTLKPAVDARFGTLSAPENTCIMGYSLAGLTALYALFGYTAFGNAACLSGSLWFRGWLGFARKNKSLHPNATIHLSVGRGERKSRNKFMNKILPCYEQTCRLLQPQCGRITLQLHNGGHDYEIAQRYACALMDLLKEA